MNYSCTVCQRYIRVAGYKICFLVLLFADANGAVKQRFILLVFQIFSDIGLLHLVGSLSENSVTECLSQIVDRSVFLHLNLHIGFIRVHAECHVGGQCPGCCGPGQNIGILTLYLKLGDGGFLLHILVALSHLMAGKRRSAARTVGHNLESFIEKPLFPDLL